MENKKVELKQNLIDKKPGALRDIIAYCKENISTMDINDETDYFLNRASTLYLMKNNIGHFNKEEAKYLTEYFAKLGSKLYAEAYGIKGEIDIEILPSEEYEEKQKGQKSIAVCIPHKDNSFTLRYSEEKVCQKLMTNDPDKFLRAMQTIIHEVVHVYQNIMVQQDYKDVNARQAKKGYRMALEKITRQVFPKFYNENYDKLLTENDAEEWGLSLSLDILRVYNKGVYELFTEEEIQAKFEQYRERSEEEKNILGEGVNSPTLKTMEFLAQNAPDFRKLYPILEVAYHNDGPRKTITELLDDRAERIAKGEPSIDDTNELLLEILNSRDTTPEERREEIDELNKYIISKGVEDKFVYELLSSRLQRYGIKETSIQEYIEITKAQVKEKGIDEVEQEKIRPEEETFRDGIGDKEEEEQGRKEDQIKDEETTWLETMQRFNERATEIEGYPKKQETVIQAISVAEKQRTEQEKGVKISNDGVR